MSVSPALALQDRASFLSLAYHARESLHGRDNDILRLRYDLENPGFAALSRITIFGGFQDVGLNLGASSSGSSFDELDLGGEVLWAKTVDDQRWGLGVRIAYAEPYEVSYEVAAVFETFREVMDYRVMAGVQGVTDDVPQREDVSPFAVAEATWWVSDTFLLRAGLQGDSDGALATTGLEVGLWRTRASFFVDFGIAIDGYRDIDEYNDVQFGLRFTLGRAKTSLKQNVRGTTLRSLHRTIEVQ